MTDARIRHRIVSMTMVVAAAGVVALLTRGLFVNVEKVPSALVGKPAANFVLPAIDTGADAVSLAAYRGKPVIINFWASWCTSCREEAQLLEAFWQIWKGKGVQVIGIAVQDTPEAAQEFARRAGKTFPLAIDTSGKTGLDYGVYGVPETFFIDANGIIRYKEAGPIDRETLLTQAAVILDAPETAAAPRP